MSDSLDKLALIVADKIAETRIVQWECMMIDGQGAT